MHKPIDTIIEARKQQQLELRQNKNGLASVKNMLVLNLARFFPHLHGKGKSAAISKLACPSQKLVRSYIVLFLMDYNFLL